MNWWEGEGLSAPSIQEAQRRDDQQEYLAWVTANETLSLDECRDLGIPRLYPVRQRAMSLHLPEDLTCIAELVAQGKIRVGL